MKSRSVQGVVRALEALVLLTGRAGSFALVPLVIIVLLDVATRKIVPLKKFVATSELNNWMSSVILQDLEWYSHTLLFTTAIAFAYLRNGHVRVDILHAALKPRVQAVIEVLGSVALLIPFSLLMTKNAIDFTISAFLSGEQSASLMGIGHTWIIKSSLVLCFLLLTVAALTTIVRAVLVILSSDPESPCHREAALKMLTPLRPDEERPT